MDVKLGLGTRWEKEEEEEGVVFTADFSAIANPSHYLLVGQRAIRGSCSSD